MNQLYKGAFEDAVRSILGTDIIWRKTKTAGSVGGFSLNKYGMPCISLTPGRSLEKTWQTLIHELGHFFQWKAGKIKLGAGGAEKIGRGQQIKSLSSSPVEDGANIVRDRIMLRVRDACARDPYRDYGNVFDRRVVLEKLYKWQ